MLATLPLHLFLEPEHFIQLWHMFVRVRHGVPVVVKLHDFEATFQVKMNVSFFKIGRVGFPYFGLWVALFNQLPRLLADAFAMFGCVHKEQFQSIVLRLRGDCDHRSAHGFAV